MRLYHVSFSTKWRQFHLEDQIREFVLESFQNTANEIHVQILALEAFQDHVHLLVGLQDHQKLSIVMQRLKGRSAREVFLAFPELRDDGSSMPFWQEGYGSRYVSLDQVETVRNYIENQESHHALP